MAAKKMTHPRILQVMAGAEIGGAEAFFTRLVLALADAGVEQAVANRPHADRREALDTAGIGVRDFTFGKWFDFRTAPGLRQLASEFGADLILAWMSRAAATIPEGDWVTAGRLGGYYKLSYYRRCDHLIGNTPDLRDYFIREGWPVDRAWYLPNFVEDQRMPPVDRASLDTPFDAPLILCMGRLHTNKAFDTALEVLAKLPVAHLWLAGAGPEESALRRKASALGVTPRVRFLGWRDDPPALLAAADIFLCSSRHEPLGNIVLEAWAQGVPVVAAAAQGPGQLIVEGETGLLAPVDDADALAGAVNRLLDDRALGVDLAGKAHEKFVQNYAQGPVVDAWLDFFDKVTSRR